MTIQSQGISDVGCVREQNEDSFLVSDELGLYVVADGMGGHLGGQTASKMAVETLSSVVSERYQEVADGAATDPIDQASVPHVLSDAVRKACERIYTASQANAELQGMGTTCTAVLFAAERAFVAHVGDSRCYLRRRQRVLQVSDDHSLVNEQVKAGLITKSQAKASRHRNIITRSVGFEPDVAVDTFALPTEPEDTFLLCSDGLTNYVDDSEILESLSTLDLCDAPKALVELAKSRGGDDNITVICIRVE